MNFAAISHRITYEYIAPLTRTSLAVRVCCAREDVAECTFYSYSRYAAPDTRIAVKMELAYRDRYNDDFRGIATYEAPGTRFLRYWFKLVGTDGSTVYLSEYGISESEPTEGFFEYQYTNEGDCVRTPDWAKGIVYYQIFPDRFYRSDAQRNRRDYMDWASEPQLDGYFGGDLRGIREKLPYIQALGAECIYLNPIFKAEFNHKYATEDYFTIDPDFGTMDEFRSFVDEAHAANIRIVLDGVFNHSGRAFAPFFDWMRNREKSDYWNWFLPVERKSDGEILRYEAFADYPIMPKLNTEFAPVRRFIVEVMLFWLRETGIDGWRLDVADEVALSTWREIRALVQREFPDALLIAETWRDAGRYLIQGDMFHTTMNYAFREAVRDFFARRSIDVAGFNHRINHALSKFIDPINHTMFNLIGSHDTARFRFEADEDVRRVALATVFQMTFPGSPSVYYGDEIGMTGKNDPDCRRGMIWDEKRQDKDLLEHTKRLIRLRKQEKALRLGTFRTVELDHSDCVAYWRVLDDERVLCLLNNGDTDAMLTVPVAATRGAAGATAMMDLLSDEMFVTADGMLTVDVGAMNARLLKVV